jgi:hypothetical protein
MPLKYSSSKKALEYNIKTEIAAGKPRNQAIAIALSIRDKIKDAQRRKRKSKNEGKTMKHLKAGRSLPTSAYLLNH